MPSDNYLQVLWRKAVLKIWGHKCLLCGKVGDDNLECHHLIKRRHWLTRHNPSNGVPLCKVKYGSKSCHQLAHTLQGEDMIRKIVGEGIWDELMRQSTIDAKSHLQSSGLTKNEFLEKMKSRLEKIIKGN